MTAYRCSAATSTGISVSAAGGRDIRRNHPAYRRIHGVMGPSPTLMAGQSDYNIAYYEE